MHSQDPQLHAYAPELLFKQTGTRYAHAWHHVKPAWYYLQVIATLRLPDRPATDFGFKASWQAQWAKAGPRLAQASEKRWLFVLKQAVPACIDPAQRIDIGESNRNQWQLIPGTAWHARCRGNASDTEQTGGHSDAD